MKSRHPVKFTTCNKGKITPVARAVKRVISCIPRTTNSVMAAAFLASPVLAGAASIDLGSLDGSDGFVINGTNLSDYAGRRVSGTGDFNGDGVDDVIVGVPGGDPNGNSSSGESYVVFGGSGLGSGGSIDPSSLTGSNGFTFNGIGPSDQSGWSVSGIGDVNGDGIDDLAIGALGGDPDRHVNAGETYVVFGGASVGSNGTFNLSSISGSNGFVINGIDTNDRSAFSVSGAGDINGDGISDVIVGAIFGDPGSNQDAGESYVIFGGAGVGSTGFISMATLTGSEGFVINGVDMDDISGRFVDGAGDVNADGVDDLIIGAVFGDADNNGKSDAGESYVVFGGSGVGSSGSLNLSSLSGSNGFVMYGANPYDLSGLSVSGAGDINGDGVDDLVIGAPYADPNGNNDAGESYVIFGKSGIGSSGSIDLASITGTDGFVVNGANEADKSGYSVSGAGDINGDGMDDLIIGAFQADTVNGIDTGESYVLFGSTSIGNGGTVNLADIANGTGFAITGGNEFDEIGRSVASAGDLNDDGIDDLIIGASIAGIDASLYYGASYVVFGSQTIPNRPQAEVSLVSSCLAGNGRVDLNIVNKETVSSLYRYELQGQPARQTTVAFEDWGRMPITGRPAGAYTVLVKRDGQTILDTSLNINCSDPQPAVTTPEVSIVNACRADNGYVLFQMVNPTAVSRPYVIVFDGVPNRSTSAAAFGQAVRATTGRPDGTYNYLVRTGSTVVDSGQVTVDCD